MMKFDVVNIACIRGEVPIFHRLSFSCSKGVALWIKGGNGLGKTSLLHCLAGLIPIESGHMSYDNVECKNNSSPYQQKFSFIGHGNPFKADLTVYENLYFWGELFEVVKSKVNETLEVLRLWHLRDLPARILSAGQKRRCNLARFILEGRPLWLMDEPLVGLDTTACKQWVSIMNDHTQKGGIIIFSTHTPLPLMRQQVFPMAPYQWIEKEGQ